MENNNGLAILVVSCDKYSDLWFPFIELFYKFWPECQYTVYVGSNNQVCKDVRVKSICIGEDRSWTDNVRAMLEKIPESHIIMLLEDFFIERKVDGKVIDGLYQYVVDNNVDCLRLCPLPRPSKHIKSSFNLGVIDYNAPYCICTMPAIWKKSSLSSLMHEGYSAWDFEKKNSAHAENTGLRLIGAYDYYIKHHNGVERGKYYQSTINLLKENNINVDINKRGVINDLTIKRKIYMKFYLSFQALRSKFGK